MVYILKMLTNGIPMGSHSVEWLDIHLCQINTSTVKNSAGSHPTSQYVGLRMVLCSWKWLVKKKKLIVALHGIVYLYLMGQNLSLRGHLPSYYDAAVCPIRPTTSSSINFESDIFGQNQDDTGLDHVLHHQEPQTHCSAAAWPCWGPPRDSASWQCEQLHYCGITSNQPGIHQGGGSPGWFFLLTMSNKDYPDIHKISAGT